MLQELKRQYRTCPLTPEQTALADKYVPLAKKIVRPYRFDYPTLSEDLLSDVMYALVEAARSFEAGRNIKFGTYCRRRIRGAITDCLRSYYKVKGFAEGHEEHIQSGFNVAWDTSYTIIGATSDDHEKYLDDEDNMEWYFKQVLPIEREVLRLYYMKGQSDQEIAQTLDRSQSSAVQIRHRATNYLRDFHGHPERQATRA